MNSADRDCQWISTQNLAWQRHKADDSSLLQREVEEQWVTESFELLEGIIKRTVPFSGVLRQPASTSPDAVIGDGHYLLPALPGAPSNEKLSGEVLLERP